MSAFNISPDLTDFETDPWEGGEPDDDHQAELVAEFDAEQADDYEVTQQHSADGILMVATRDCLQVGWVSAKNPVRNEQ